tara:strand:- start:42 stop:350 length:309 start_codon:yes stop_codon:yes gene_type:complete
MYIPCAIGERDSVHGLNDEGRRFSLAVLSGTPRFLDEGADLLDLTGYGILHGVLELFSTGHVTREVRKTDLGDGEGFTYYKYGINDRGIRLLERLRKRMDSD